MVIADTLVFPNHQVSRNVDVGREDAYYVYRRRPLSCTGSRHYRGFLSRVEWVEDVYRQRHESTNMTQELVHTKRIIDFSLPPKFFTPYCSY